MRRATIATTHDDGRAATVAAAVRPDNTDEMETRVDGRQVVTAVERETTGGLRSTVDDFVVNCTVATRLAGDAAEAETDRQTGTDEPSQTDDAEDETNADTETNT